MVINLTNKQWITIMRAGPKKLITHRMIYNPSNKTESPPKNITIAENTHNCVFH